MRSGPKQISDDRRHPSLQKKPPSPLLHVSTRSTVTQVVMIASTVISQDFDGCFLGRFVNVWLMSSLPYLDRCNPRERVE